MSYEQLKADLRLLEPCVPYDPKKRDAFKRLRAWIEARAHSSATAAIVPVYYIDTEGGLSKDTSPDNFSVCKWVDVQPLIAEVERLRAEIEARP